MKKMTCKQLGGACDTVFEGDSFEELAEKSKAHGMEMYQKQDPIHLEAMANMQSLMQSPEALNEWFEQKKALFESLPNT